MELWQAVLLGIIQGITEFLPVSSSGHLRVVEHFTGLSEPQTLFDVCLHLGTLLAVVLYFARDLLELAAAPVRAVRLLIDHRDWRRPARDPGVRGLWFLFLGSVPTAFIGYRLGGYLEGRSMSLLFVGSMFLVNSAVLFSSRLVTLPTPASRLNTGYVGMRFYDALLVGIVQGLSVTRGISRSGSTISAALMLGVDRQTAARFSFLLSVPAICGATLYSLTKYSPSGDADWVNFLAGAAVALVSGAICLKILMSVVRKGRLHRFGWYTLVLGLALVAWHYQGHRLDELWHTWMP